MARIVKTRERPSIKPTDALLLFGDAAIDVTPLYSDISKSFNLVPLTPEYLANVD